VVRPFRLPLSWINRDGKLIILSWGLRAFVQGSASVILALYLDKLGYTLVEIGAFLSAGVAGAACLNFVVSLVAERMGRRRLMVFFGILISAASLGMVFANNLILLIVVAFFGNVGTGGISPAASLEQASLADAAPPPKRTDLYAVYRISGLAGAALGALAAGLPALFQGGFSISEISSYKLMYVGFCAIFLVVSLLYGLLSPEIEVARTQQRWSNPFKLPSRRLIFTLTGLFAVDGFSTYLFIQSLAAYWFYTRFGLALKDLALVFSLSQVLAAISLWLAAKIGNKIGLINTMVFTHIPSSLFLIAALYAPSAGLAIVFWQLRAFLAQMDQPVRDSYTMSLVQPHERVVMAGINTVGRNVTGTVAPLASTALWQAISAAVPILGSAVLKISYDLSLFFMFRKVKAPQEVREGK
jgi:MFS family permease